MNVPSAAPERTPLADLVHVVDPAPWLAMLEERFGMPPAVFAEYVLFETGGKFISIVARSHRPAARPAPVETGLAFIRTNLRYPKLTTASAMLFGRHATRNVVDVDRAGADAYLARVPLTLDAAQEAACTGLGYVLVRYRGLVLGVGFYRHEEGGGRLASLFPKAWSRA